LLAQFLPPRCREAVAGDLEEVWRDGRTTVWKWCRLALVSLAVCWFDHLRYRDMPHDAIRAGDRSMRTFIQDLSYGLRQMRRAPGFTAAAVLTLGLGIGVNAATFSIVDVLSLKPLNYRDPSRVAFILGVNAALHQRGMNMPLADAIDIGRQ